MAFYVRLIFCGQNDLSNHGSVQKRIEKNPMCIITTKACTP